MKKELNVKNQSVNEFFKEYLRNYKPENYNGSVYHLMQDELFFKKGLELVKGDIVEIDLFDTAERSNKRLTNHYKYEVQNYDDISIKLVLIDFNITYNEKNR